MANMWWEGGNVFARVGMMHVNASLPRGMSGWNWLNKGLDSTFASLSLFVFAFLIAVPFVSRQLNSFRRFRKYFQ